MIKSNFSDTTFGLCMDWAVIGPVDKGSEAGDGGASRPTSKLKHVRHYQILLSIKEEGERGKGEESRELRGKDSYCKMGIII